MKILKVATLNLAGLSLALLAMPAAAQSLADTHEARWTPTGKVPAMTYHPLKRSCGHSAQPIHLSGKTAFHAAQPKARCATAIATADQRTPDAPIVEKE